MDDAVQARLAEAEVLQKIHLVGVVELRDLGFDRRAYRHHLGTFADRMGAHFVQQLIAALQACFIHVGDVEHRLDGDQVELAELRFFFRRQRQGACRFPGIEMRLHALEQVVLGDGFLGAGLGVLARTLGSFGNEVEVGQRQFGVDDFGVADGVHFFHDVDDVVVHERAHNVHDRIGLADVRQERIALALALAGAFNQAGDVHELHRRRQRALRFDDGT